MQKQFLLPRGFHLIEVLIVLTMVSLLAAMTIPVYSQYIVRMRRIEAATMLSRLAVAMEQFHFAQNSYLNVTLAKLHFPEMVADNRYQLKIQMEDNEEFLLSAIPVGTQAKKDKLCNVLTLNSYGEKNVTGTGNVNDCW